MGNWKELGVVPDSDDEGWDSEDSPPLSTSISPPKAQPYPRDEDVWDFPGSPSPPPKSPRVLQSTSKLIHEPQSTDIRSHRQGASQLLGSTIPDLPQVDSDGEFKLLTREHESPDPLAGAPDEHQHSSSVPDPRDDISPSIVQITAPSANPFPGSYLGQGPDELPWDHDHEQENHAEPVERRSDPPRPSQSGSPTRARRSLRPRKPIQEHPYLLENAQYSKLVKSHGVKPIRVTVEEREAIRRRNAENSQDHDYTGDESQTASGGPDEESQRYQKVTKPKSFDGEVDELALSQSPRTSSPHRYLRASSEQSPGQQTDDTSINDDEEFPDIRDLTGTQKKLPSKLQKRQTASATSMSRKRLKTKHVASRQESPLRERMDALDIPSSPGPVDLNSRIGRFSFPDDSPRSPSPPRPARFAVSFPRQTTPPSQPDNAAEPIDLTTLTAESEHDDEVIQPSDNSSPDSESELIRRTGRRIKGVLPASWLRLDQQTRKPPPTTARRQSPSRSPDQPRLGLAMRKFGGSRPTVSTKSFLEELYEDDDDNETRRNGQLYNDSERELIADDDDALNLDDTNSVIEEDFVDWMLPGQKRNRTSSYGPATKRKKTNQKLFHGETRKWYRQQKISNSVQHLNSSLSKTPKSQHQKTSVRALARRELGVSPPALSIVDFLEPEAPKFIKVAARAARKRRDMGRSKPSNKSINLGSRTDNVDALSVLKAWRTGKIKTSKVPPATTRPKQSNARQPLRSVSTNQRRQAKVPARLSFTRPQKVTKQVSIDEFVSVDHQGERSEDLPANTIELRKAKSHSRDDHMSFRPAQLEAGVPEDLTTRKKMLDLVFRKCRREVLAPTFQLRRSTPEHQAVPPRQTETPPRRTVDSEVDVLEDVLPKGSTKQKAIRNRKSVPPRRLDLDAPQFKHANDPLPDFGLPSVEEPSTIPHQGSKLFGLGPFGTHYSQSFDIFPLHTDTFFHHTTILGNGTLQKALEFRPSQTITTIRPAVSFQISDRHFHWGRWTDTTSSELGMLFDLLVERVEESREAEGRLGENQATECADHILNFMLESVSVDEETELRSFVQRLVELLLGFLNQTSTPNQHASHTLLQVNSRLLICALVLLRFCQSTIDMSTEELQAEDILQRFTKIIIGRLLNIGLSEVRATYDSLQRLAFRERGIRNDSVVTICWVVVIKVLESAQMPRAGFWDLMCTSMTVNVLQTNDAQILEGLWRDMFTLLPLGEFDDAGVLSKGLRHVVPLQGWALPQKLLKCVFESYKSDQRQSPSFNEYCRALLGRCHHLIEQWGWVKCGAIVGTIFDFFGHQNLSHLRNEEVYKSPRFLEELSEGPCLSIEPEDRCFHIFLKILAVAVQNMRQQGLSNDVRNLIARCLPNHNRQYSKEQTIHSHDLASLRNHHDLLCTLFWAAPPDHRRPVDLIEKLVQPASSHKEACLINLRAWSQLARYIVSSGCSLQEFRPFMSWQNNVSQQILNQYMSAAADVQHQYMSLAKEDRRDIQQKLLESIVAANQAAAKDVLHFSVIASLDVMKHSPSLSSATFSFNVGQMSKVYNRLIMAGDDLDWGILRVCFETVDLFVKRLEDLWYKMRESTSESVSSHGNHEFEDAVEFLDDKVVQGFVVAVRRAMFSPDHNVASKPGPSSVVVENAVILCGRIASLFIDGGKRQLQHFFSAGKYGLFEALPDELDLKQRRFVPLFVATLLKNHIFNFSSIGCTHFDIWISSLVKPFHALRYEDYLAKTLKSLNVGFMKGAVIKPGTVPDYNTNRDFFACGISYMRRELRQVEFVQRKTLRAKYEKVLKAVMQQIKTDLKSFNLNSIEHQNYISFVREIVGLIKSHGSDICTIDPFYYQVSAEYSPAKEDPQLHTAGILAYGLKLEEGEITAIPQLFYYLYNHFKSSLAHGQLDAESKIIENGMKDDNILAFVIGRMLPAITRASSHSPDIWPLLGVYSKALQSALSRSALPREIPEACLDDVVTMLTSIMSWLRDLAEKSTETTGLTPTQAHIFTELMGVCNAIRPSLVCWLMQNSSYSAKMLRRRSSEITRVAKQAAALLGERASRGSQIAVRDVPVMELIALAQDNSLSSVVHLDSNVAMFTQNLIREVQNSWVVTTDIITARVATTSSAQPGTQATQGVKNDLDTKSGLLSELFGGLNAWISEMSEEDHDSRRGEWRRRQRQRPRRSSNTMALDE